MDSVLPSGCVTDSFEQQHKKDEVLSLKVPLTSHTGRVCQYILLKARSITVAQAVITAGCSLGVIYLNTLKSLFEFPERLLIQFRPCFFFPIQTFN